MIVCSAIIGQQNNPIYLKSYIQVEDQLKFHYIVHCSLDAVEEKVLLRRVPGEVADSYLGLLYPTEEYRVYGYITNTHVKFILVLAEVQTKDEALSKIFKRMHSLYVDATSNPFHTHGQPIKSLRFDLAIDNLVRNYNSAALPQQQSLPVYAGVAAQPVQAIQSGLSTMSL